MEKKPVKKKWIKARHLVVTRIAAATFGIYVKLKYRIKPEKFKREKGKNYLVLFNHQTAYDQFFVGLSMGGAVYYLASEDLFSKGFVSSLLRYLVAPIPIKKQVSDAGAVRNILRVVREGGTVAIAPEGNRTFSGRTCYMNPAIASLAKKLGMPIALYRIEGGYGVHPRWSDAVRKGKMRGYVSRVITPEEYADMSPDELMNAIKSELCIDEAAVDGEYLHKRSAEYLERMLYVCPSCGFSVFRSEKSRVKCTKCGLEAEYLSTKEFRGTDGELPFRFAADWYGYQESFVNSQYFSEYANKPIYAESVCIREVIVYKNKRIIDKNAKIAVYADRITVNGKQELIFPTAETSAVTVLGKNKLNIYFGDKIYQIKGDKRFNALKYVHIFNRCRNILKGDTDEQFLGL